MDNTCLNGWIPVGTMCTSSLHWWLSLSKPPMVKTHHDMVGTQHAPPYRYFFQQIDFVGFFVSFFLLLLHCQTSEALTGLRVGDKT